MSISLTYKGNASRITGLDNVILSNITVLSNTVTMLVCISNEAATPNTPTVTGFNKKWYQLFSASGSTTENKTIRVWMCKNTTGATSNITVSYNVNAYLHITAFSVTDADTLSPVLQLTTSIWNEGTQKIQVPRDKWGPYKTASAVVSFAVGMSNPCFSSGAYVQNTLNLLDDAGHAYQFCYGINSNPQVEAQIPYVDAVSEAFGVAIEVRSAAEVNYPTILTHSLQETYIKPFPNHGLMPKSKRDTVASSSIITDINMFHVYDTLVIVTANSCDDAQESVALFQTTTGLTVFDIYNTSLVLNYNASDFHDAVSSVGVATNITVFTLYDTLVIKNTTNHDDDSVQLSSVITTLNTFTIQDET